MKITGKKATDSNQQPILSQHPTVALFFLVIVVGFSAYAFKNFDPDTRQLSLLGITFNLGESEEASEEEGKTEVEADDDDDDDGQSESH